VSHPAEQQNGEHAGARVVRRPVVASAAREPPTFGLEL
jgi:hypothetical protein